MLYNCSMKDVLPFYTKDGSVGLYSNSDKDIYHSVYGAYSEAYDKFVMPAHFDKFLNKNNEIKILDLCYGIGYNTKSFLNYFIKNFSQKKIKKNNPLTGNIDTIHTNNINFIKSNDEIYSDNILDNKSIDMIHGDNIIDHNFENLQDNYKKNKNENFEELENNSKYENSNTEKHVDNIQNKTTETNIIDMTNQEEKEYSIKIDAIDYNETLMKLSPLFRCKPFFNFSKKTNIEIVDKYLSKQSPNKLQHKMFDEANFIIFINLLNQYKDNYFSKEVKDILSDKKFSSFFDENMIDFKEFYKNKGYNLSSKGNKSTFLHNIYYQYISKSYKNTLKALENNEISIRYISDDAREFVKSNLNRYDFIFLDAFTPTKCPALWTYDFFKNLYQHLSYDGMLLTYSSSSVIRNAMLKANFYIGKVFNENENRFTGTVAVKNADLIEHPLDKYEIGLLKTKAGIVYTDINLKDSNEEILERRHLEVKSSNLISSSQYIKNFKELSNEV